MRIDGERLQRRLQELGAIGRGQDNGVTRLAFSEEDRRARNLFIRWLEDVGCEVKIDAVGNIIGRLSDSFSKPALAIGSHLDTVPNGGIFDGALGCVAGLECLEAIAEGQIELRHPLEVIVFSDEEGSRFGTGLLGSRAMIGALTPEELQQARDANGIAAWDAMLQFGLRPDLLSQAHRKKDELAAYLELHIEQGAVLVQRHKQVGVVTGIVGIKRFAFDVQGEANHAGTTPLSQRKDALLGAARLVLSVRDAASAAGSADAVATVGRLSVKPGAVNVVPGRVVGDLEIRDVDEDGIAAIENLIREKSRAIAEKEGLEIVLSEAAYVPPVPLDSNIQEEVQAACDKLGISFCAMPSGAGHDAQSMAKVWPTGMIFVPSQGGISHSPQEFTRQEDIENGANVLLQTILALDKLL